jgi:hypothetical protein
MPDELKIGVSAPGAAEAAAQLQQVAAAEGQVAAAAGAPAAPAASTAEAMDKTAEAAVKLGGRNMLLLNSLRMLGPEFRIAADTISVVANNAVGATMALGLIGVAITAVVYAISKFTDAQAEQKRKALEVQAALEEQFHAYVQIEQAVEKARLAEARRGVPRAPAIVSEEAIKRVAAVGVEIGLGKEGITEVAEALTTADQPMDDATLRTFALWIRLGYGERYPSDRAKLRAFRAQLRRIPNLADRLEKEQAASVAAAPKAAAAAKAEAAEVAREARAPIAAEDIYGIIAEEETKIGRRRTPEDIKRWVQQELDRIAREEIVGGRPEAARRELAEFLRQHPLLKTIPYMQGMTIEEAIRGVQPIDREKDLRLRLGPEDYEAYQKWRVQREPTSQPTSQPTTQPTTQPATVVHGNVHTGGTQYYGQYTDPAGVPMRRAP